MTKPQPKPTPRKHACKANGYVRVVFPPYDSPQQWESYISTMYDAVGRNGCRNLLVDCRATRKKVPIVELFNLCVYAAVKLVPLYPRMAVLISPQAANHDRFGETVLRNRGLNAIRFVADEQEALAWLLDHGTGV